MNMANPREHVPAIERSNRVIKERVRAGFHVLPFSRLPKILVQYFVMESAKKLNYFPPKGGISPYYSPRMIVHHENLEFEKHCEIPFGHYVQAHDEPTHKNSLAPRTRDCLYLRYVSNQQGGHELLDLRTKKVIKRGKVTLVPMTNDVIAVVHAMADAEGAPQGLD